MVNASNGNLYHSSGIDISLRIRGFGKQLQVIRSYNSKKSNDITDFGRSWTFNYGIKLEDNITNMIMIT
ncbi:MAG: hypothetical protein JXA22_07140 [Candidatus Thermoplasmatota archaeon]|nr:hypothetical protein [Candidatus Thermoplasmatota archaeon]